jgi:hypothetical protein
MTIFDKMLAGPARERYEKWCEEHGLCPFCGIRLEYCECNTKEITLCIACGHRLPERASTCSCHRYGICKICSFPNDKCKCIEWGP